MFFYFSFEVIMRVKTFDLTNVSSRDASLEDKVNNWFEQNDVTDVEVVTTENLLIIFYKSFVPKC